MTNTRAGAAAATQGMLYLRRREEEMRDINEGTNGRVAWMSVLSLGICVGMSVWQVRSYTRLYLRSESRKRAWFTLSWSLSSAAVDRETRVGRGRALRGHLVRCSEPSASVIPRVLHPNPSARVVSCVAAAVPQALLHPQEALVSARRSSFTARAP